MQNRNEKKGKSFNKKDKKSLSPKANSYGKSIEFGSDNKKSFADRPPRRDGGFSNDKKSFSDKPKRKSFGVEKRSFDDRSPRRGAGFSNDRKSFADKPKREGFGVERKRSFKNDSFEKGANFQEKKPFSREKSEERPRKRRFEKKDNQATSSSLNPPKYNYRNNKEGLPMKARKQIIQEELREANEEIRLNRYISNSGLCSRREADDLIVSGQISVNGRTITELGYKVKRTDIVKYGNKILNPEKLVYILLNKPKDFITTTDDPQERRTVMDLVRDACTERVYPVGRLDRNTTGLILLTNDGELADNLSHPSNNIKKIYQVELNKPITTEDFEAIKKGFELEDGFIKADDLAIVTPDAEVIGIEIHSGRNRIVRRIFEHLGYEVLKLDRTSYAGLTKKDLPRGKWRFLTEKEVIRLKYML